MAHKFRETNILLSAIFGKAYLVYSPSQFVGMIHERIVVEAQVAHKKQKKGKTRKDEPTYTLNNESGFP